MKTHQSNPGSTFAHKEILSSVLQFLFCKSLDNNMSSSTIDESEMILSILETATSHIAC